jgi:glycosyltransferase involved in cell wall biosynthesis
LGVKLPRVVAIVAAFNEGDIIGQVIDHLVREGILVYVLDNWSTDTTAHEAEQRLGRGVLAVERFPVEPPSPRYSLGDILRRKEELARALEADWLIHCDADELRESPWLGTTLQEAIGIVDALGYNAVDSDVISFFPTEPQRAPGADVREALPYFEPTSLSERVNVSCWKSRPDVDLTSSGGIDVAFAGRNVFPSPFLLRHYPIRDQAHGERKIFDERLARFDPDERKLGWHRQYDGLRKGQSFVRSPAGLVRFDPVQVRVQLALRHREVERLEHEWRAALEQRNDHARHEAQEAQAALRALAEKNAVLAQTGHELNEGYRATLRQLEEANARARDTDEQLAQMREAAAAYEAQATALGDELAQASTAFAARVATLQAELEQARGELAQLHSDNHALQSSADDARTAAHAARDAATLAERALALVRDDRGVAEASAAGLELQLEQALRALGESAATLRSRDAELAMLRELVQRRDDALGQAHVALGRITELERRLREVHMSLSWQVTQPLRRAGALLIPGKKGNGTR